MLQISSIRPMPSWPISSSLPTKGEINLAPALAARRACPAVKHKVTFTSVPASLSARHVINPSRVNGTFTVTLGAMAASLRPSVSMVSKSVAVTSALTGPSTRPQICEIVSKISRPDLAISDGFVVTPSIKPVSKRALICPISALSRKIFMLLILF